MATLDELVVRIKADATQLERELNRASATVTQSTGKMSGAVGALRGQFASLIPALGAAALVGYTRHLIDAAGAMQDLADRTGVSAGFLSGLKTEVENAGGSVEGLAQAVFLMNNAIGEAANNAEGPVADSFKKLGIDLEGLKRLKPEEQFYLIADAIAKLGTEFEQTEAARNIFGRSVAGLLPLLKQGADGIKAVGDAAKKTGDALSNETIATIDQFGDAMNRLATTIGNKVVTAFAEALIAAQRFFGSVSAMSSEALAREISATEGLLAAEKALPDGQKTRDRMGNVVDKSGPLNNRLAELRKAYNDSQSSSFGPNLPEKRAARSVAGTKEMSAAEKELNRIREEGGRITERNMTAYEKYTAGVQLAQKALKAKAIDETTYQRELVRLQDELATATEDGMGRAAKATEDLTVNIRSGLASAFEDAVFDAKSAGTAISGILDGIARQIARKAFIDPLSGNLSGLIGSTFTGSGFGKMLGFADGGSPPVGVPSIVGERGPEIFVPNTAGTIIPNHAMGGSVTVNNSWTIGGGVTRQELASLIPYIEGRAKAATFAAIERGGAAAKVVNRLS